MRKNQKKMTKKISSTFGNPCVEVTDEVFLNSEVDKARLELIKMKESYENGKALPKSDNWAIPTTNYETQINHLYYTESQERNTPLPKYVPPSNYLHPLVANSNAPPNYATYVSDPPKVNNPIPCVGSLPKITNDAVKALSYEHCYENEPSIVGVKYNKKVKPIEYVNLTFSVNRTESKNLIDSNSKNKEDLLFFEQIKNEFLITRKNVSTMIYVIIISKKEEENVITHIPCFGVSFGGYAKNLSSDTYVFNCVTYGELGYIPFSLELKNKNDSNWKMNIPINNKLIESSLDVQQRKAYIDILEKYDRKNYKIEFLQMLEI